MVRRYVRRISNEQRKPRAKLPARGELQQCESCARPRHGVDRGGGSVLPYACTAQADRANAMTARTIGDAWERILAIIPYPGQLA